MQIVYRASPDKPTGKQRPEWFSKARCMDNWMQVFVSFTTHWHLIGHGFSDKRLQARKFPGAVHSIQAANGAEAFLRALDYTLSLDAPDSEIVYLVEDDYLHLPGAPEAIHEGLGLGFDYVTLYDHPDKYLRDGPNELVNGAEDTRLYLGPSCHWKLTNSTTMTFACRLGMLRKDAHVFYEESMNKVVPPDYAIFRNLCGRDRSIGSAVPGLATHCESKWLAPLVDWGKVCKGR